ncbi:MAG: SirB2 family protein [Ferrimonas sp.]
MPYEALKHLHFTVIAISILLFSLRFVWSMSDSIQMQKKWVKIVPHVVDTLLLISGVMLIMVTGFTPMNSPWLFEKLLALVAYIALGMLAFKSQRSKAYRVMAFVGALGWLFYMSRLAMTKMPILLS